MMMLTFDRWTSHCLYEEQRSAAVILRPITSSLEREKEREIKPSNVKKVSAEVMKRRANQQVKEF